MYDPFLRHKKVPIFKEKPRADVKTFNQILTFIYYICQSRGKTDEWDPENEVSLKCHGKPEGIEDTIIIYRRGDIVGLLFQLLNGVAHGHTDTRLDDHGGVVAAITKSNGATDVEAFVACHGEDTFTLVGPVGRDIGKLRMPAARDALGHARHEFRFVVGREERRELQDILLEHLVERRRLVEILHSQHLAEDRSTSPPGSSTATVLTAHHNQAVAFLLAVVHACQNIFLGDRLAGDQFGAHIAQCAIGGDIAVDQWFDGSQVGDDERWPARGDIHA